MTPYACPKCGNTSSQKGITHCYIEGRIAPVKGFKDGTVYVDFLEQEGAEVDEKDRHTALNTPNETADLEHYHCNACGWNWFDPSKKRELPATGEA